MKRVPLICVLLIISNFIISQNEVNNKKIDSTKIKSRSVSANTTSSGTVTDIDGNVYLTITIGRQTWMKENLRVTRYANGDSIGTLSPDTLNIVELKSPKYQWAYNGDEKNAPTYGRLYTWWVVSDSRNVCPTGWRIPSDEEFCILENTIEPNTDNDCNLIEHRGKNQGGFLKEAGLLYWKSPNLGADNRSAFSVMPAGIRYATGLFHCLGSHAYFWTTTEYDAKNVMTRRIYYDSKDVSRSWYFKEDSLSIRCIKN